MEVKKLTRAQIGPRVTTCPVCKKSAVIESINGKSHRIVCRNPLCKLESKC